MISQTTLTNYFSKVESDVSRWEGLPKDILVTIFSNLSPAKVMQCALVSKKWAQAASDQFLWKLFADRLGVTPPQNNTIFTARLYRSLFSFYNKPKREVFDDVFSSTKRFYSGDRFLVESSHWEMTLIDFTGKVNKTFRHEHQRPLPYINSANFTGNTLFIQFKNDVAAYDLTSHKTTYYTTPALPGFSLHFSQDAYHIVGQTSEDVHVWEKCANPTHHLLTYDTLDPLSLSPELIEGIKTWRNEQEGTFSFNDQTVRIEGKNIMHDSKPIGSHDGSITEWHRSKHFLFTRAFNAIKIWDLDTLNCIRTLSLIDTITHFLVNDSNLFVLTKDKAPLTARSTNLEPPTKKRKRAKLTLWRFSF